MTDVPEEPTVIITAATMKMEASENLWNVDQFLPDYTAQRRRKQSSSHSTIWEPEISRTLVLPRIWTNMRQCDAELSSTLAADEALWLPGTITGCLVRKGLFIFTIATNCPWRSHHSHTSFWHLYEVRPLIRNRRAARHTGVSLYDIRCAANSNYKL
jgi:hypothetical protein